MSSQLTPLLLLVVLLVVFWLVVLRPARTQQRNQQALQRSLEVGEDVVLSSGIFGTVTDLDDAQVGLEIAPGTVIRVARQVVVRRVEDVAPEAAATLPATEEDLERPAIFADESPEHPRTTAPEIAPHEVPETEVTNGADPDASATATADAEKRSPAKKRASTKKASAKKVSAKKAGAADEASAGGATGTGATAAASQPLDEHLDEQLDGTTERG